MPELPEVENIRRQLLPALVGREIASVATTAPSYFFLTPPATLKKELPGKKVVEVGRHGKYLLVSFEDGTLLLLHLGMTGQLLTSGVAVAREQRAFEPDVHTHLRLGFRDGGTKVFFRDTRKFGKVKLLRQGEQDPRLTKLGPDALGVTGEHLYQASRKRRSSIKGLLLDQSVAAGIGNIYADEALFISAIRPSTSAQRVSKRRCDALAAAARTVLERSILVGGSTMRDYRKPDGAAGSYQEERRVYARAGLACLVCGTAIRKAVIAQRTSHYCPSCQR